MILIFKSNFTTTWQSNRKGFKVEVVADETRMLYSVE